jgi:hypothetical protein
MLQLYRPLPELYAELLSGIPSTMIDGITFTDDSFVRPSQHAAHAHEVCLVSDLIGLSRPCKAV